MAKKILHIFLLIAALSAIILLVISPMFVFNTITASKIRETAYLQKIAPQRLFISCWRNIKTSYHDPSMNHQDWNRWKYKYLKHIKTNEDVYVAINTMLTSLNDEYSVFLDKNKSIIQKNYIHFKAANRPEARDLFESAEPVYVDLDVSMGLVKDAYVSEVSKDYSHFQKGDKILSVNNYKIKDMELNSAIKLIQGGSYFSKMEVLRGNEIKTFTTIVGAVFVNKTKTEWLEDNILYIAIYSLMGKHIFSTVNSYINDCQDASGYIIDLRGNQGGLFLNALYIADELIEKGTILTIEYRNKAAIKVNATIDSNPPQKPIIILVNNKTASAAEILAGALRSNNKAFIIGTPTYGKNKIQQIILMPNNTCLNLTMADYKFENGYKLEDGKIQPDYIVSNTYKDYIAGNDKVLKKAIEMIKNLNSIKSSS